MFDATASQEEKAEHYKSVLRRYIENVRKKDVDAICALFSDDAIVEDPVGDPSRLRQGAGEIRGFYEEVVARAHLEIVEPPRASFGASAAMGVRARIPGFDVDAISVADFDDRGLIRRYRAYWGPTDLRPMKPSR